MRVTYILGSKSDYPIIEEGVKLLHSFGVEARIFISSAHRTPERTMKIIKEEEKITDVFITVAGGAAHLPGFVAAFTIKPVIGLPVSAEPFKGMDSLFSMVQMPKGIPVGVVSAGKWGGINSAVFAAEILSIKYPEVEEKLIKYRDEMRKKVEEEVVE